MLNQLYERVEALAEKYILIDSLLFKIMSTPEKETAVLAILETCTDKILSLYHSSLFAGHQGIKRHIKLKMINSLYIT